MIYFNPPFASNVKSRVGEQILKLVKNSFHPSNPLHKIFNKNTIKVSYRTTANISQIITGHNRRLLNKLSPIPAKPCTCRAEACPVDGKCQQEETIYQATVTHTNPASQKQEINTYIGLAATTCYKRPISRSCKLCTLERYILICRPDLHTLNKNKEFGNECLHKGFSRLS